MAIDIRVIRPKDFLRTRADGELNMAASLDLLRELAYEIKRTSIDRVLIDTRAAESKLDSLGLYALAEYFAKNPDLAHALVALLAPEQRIDRARFLTLVADNRGAHAKAFSDFESAIDWLVMDPESDPRLAKAG